MEALVEQSVVPRLVAEQKVAQTPFVEALRDGGWAVTDPGSAAVELFDADLNRRARVRVPSTDPRMHADAHGRLLVVADREAVTALTLDGEVLWRRETPATDCRLADRATLWLCGPDSLTVVDANVGRELDRAALERPWFPERADPDLVANRYERPSLRLTLTTEGRIAASPMPGGYFAGAAGLGYLSMPFEDGHLTWRDARTGTTLAERSLADITPDGADAGSALLTEDYAILAVNRDAFHTSTEDHLLLATRTLRPAAAVEYPNGLRPCSLRTATVPGRWLTADSDDGVLRLWELADPADQPPLF